MSAFQDVAIHPEGVDMATEARPRMGGSQRADVPPPAQLLGLIAGRWVTHMVAAAAEFGVADLIGEAPVPVAELASRLDVDADALNRLLRGLTVVGVFAETSPHTYAHTPLSQGLRSDCPWSMRGMARMVALPGSVRGWLELGHSVRTGESAFFKVHGVNPFDYFKGHPEEGAVFHEAMTSFSRSSVPGLLGAYDFGRFREVVDIGGGHGLFLRMLLERVPRTKAILFDLPEVIANVPKAPLGGRFRTEEGSFFEAVPAGADAYFMKHILHDWSDGHCRLLLQNIRKVMDPNGRVLVAEMVLPEDGQPHFGKILDLEMLALTEGGRERTAAEFRALLASANLKLEKVHATQGPISLVEASAI